MHIRRKILEHFRDQLKTDASLTAVYIQRIAPERVVYPFVTLFAENETCETLTIHQQPRSQDRTITVSVNAFIMGTPDAAKTEIDLDNMAVKIEAKMTKPAISFDVLLTSTDFEVIEDDPLIHVLKLTYQCSYQGTEFNSTTT